MKKIYIHTLGCKVNQYDSQAMLEQFLDKAYVATNSPEEADICLINTCTVTSTADKKSLQLIHKFKRLSPNCDLIICGCMAQNKPEDLIATEARLIIGTQYRGKAYELYEKAIAENKQIIAVDELSFANFESLSVAGHNQHTRAVIKIQEGCNYNCSYCIIPSVRGKIRSRSLDSIMQEAKNLAAAGYKEIVFTGINLSCYGMDFNENIDLINAIEHVSEIAEIKRIRLSSLEPNLVNDDTARRLAACKKLCPHFHLALQSGSDNILGAMRRRYNTTMFENAVNALRKHLPECGITTDVIVGFPSETDEDFNNSIEFIKKINFQKVHVFPFSPRKNTDAAIMPNPISNEIKKERSRLLISTCQELMKNIFNASLGKLYEVLLEEEIRKNVWRAYTGSYLPVEIYGNYSQGDIFSIKITQVKSQILVGEKI